MKFTEKIQEYENKLNETKLTYEEITAKIEKYVSELIIDFKAKWKIKKKWS